MVSRRSRALIAIASVLLALLAVEVYLRLFAPVLFMQPSAGVSPGWPLTHQRSEVPGLPYELLPGATGRVDDFHVEVNSVGMRDDEPLSPDVEGLVRVIGLGDSIAFGWRVAPDETYSAHLETLLSRPDRRVEVLNAGVSGYGTREQAAQYRHLRGRFDHAAVLVGYCLNDPTPLVQQPLPRHFLDTEPWQHSHLLRALARRRFHAQLERLGGGDLYRAVHAAQSTHWSRSLGAFDELAELASEEGVPVVVAIFPWPKRDSWTDYDYTQLHEQVAVAARERGFHVVDLLDSFSEWPVAEVVFSPVDPHPTPRGHELAADEVALTLGPLLDEAELHRELASAEN
jgi:hypothetical protein